ncbi:hypothetical protein OIU79_026340 [Salix purpurea]|uniref:Uncharacterized protein n=1 Tax=Salix purpurea TaxID=77065 RepID=A0A9Q1A0L8_SALPP|nr:hypothetical protein OIU79_026340 [Salix purpurea]
MLVQNQTFQGKALVLDEVGFLMVIMEFSMVPRVVSMVLMPCSPAVAIPTIEALILKAVEEAMVVINLVHTLIKVSLILVIVFLFLALTFPSVKSIARKAM